MTATAVTQHDPIADHTHIERLINRFVEAIEKQQPLAQQQLIFKLLKTDFMHHMKWEEAVLFALYDATSGLRSGPTRMLRAEHAEIELMIRSLEKEQDKGYSETTVFRLADFIREHAEKEKAILYPVIGEQIKRKKRGADYREAIA